MTPAIETIQSPPYTSGAAAPAAAVAMTVTFLDHDVAVVPISARCPRASVRVVTPWMKSAAMLLARFSTP